MARDDRSDPTPNGNANPFDITDPDLHGLAGYVASLSARVNEMKDEQARQGRVLDKVAQALGIETDKSDPPPNYREKFDSNQKEIEALQRSRAEELAQIEALKKADADTTGSLKAVTEDIAATKTEVAETKVIVRVGLIEGIPKLAKVGAGLTAAILALVALGAQIWSVIHGH